MQDIVQQLRRKLHCLKRMTKYGIFILLLLCVGHCGLLHFGYDLFSVHALFCLFALMLGLTLSKLFGLCWLHRMYVIYISLVLFSVVMRRHDMFEALGIDIHLARGVMFWLGIILVIVTVWKTKDCDY